MLLMLYAIYFFGRKQAVLWESRDRLGEARRDFKLRFDRGNQGRVKVFRFVSVLFSILGSSLI